MGFGTSSLSRAVPSSVRVRDWSIRTVQVSYPVKSGRGLQADIKVYILTKVYSPKIGWNVLGNSMEVVYNAIALGLGRHPVRVGKRAPK